MKDIFVPQSSEKRQGLPGSLCLIDRGYIAVGVDASEFFGTVSLSKGRER